MVEAYDAFRADEAREKGRIWYWNISRQFGKSHSSCVLGLEECLRRPGAQVKYAAQDQKNARSIAFPQMEKLLRDCPEGMRPQFRPQDGVYYFPHNGSRLTIAGADRDNIRKLRGQAAHLCIIDEGGFIGNLQKLVLEVLLPQTTTTKGRLVVATTPPDSAGHFASELARTCESRGAYAKFTIDDNCLLGEKEKLEIESEYGGREASRFRREYLCEFVTDTQNAVVPEFTDDAKKEVVSEFEVPEYFDAYVSLDGGFVDNAGALFALYDYNRAKVCIQDEWLKNKQLTADIAQGVVEKETELWGKSPVLQTDRQKQLAFHSARLTRVMDHDPSALHEFLENHGMTWKPARKSGNQFDLKARVNLLNQAIRQRSLEIHPRCKHLIRQLHNCTWAGASMADGSTPRRTFSRTSTDGHYDLVAALLYLLPEIDMSHNPYPPNQKDMQKFFNAFVDPRDEMNDTEAQLHTAFALPELDL